MAADGRPGMSNVGTQASKQEVPKNGHLFLSENRSQTEGSCVNTSDSITWRQANIWKNNYEPGEIAIQTQKQTEPD